MHTIIMVASFSSCEYEPFRGIEHLRNFLLLCIFCVPSQPFPAFFVYDET